MTLRLTALLVATIHAVSIENMVDAGLAVDTSTAAETMTGAGLAAASDLEADDEWAMTLA